MSLINHINLPDDLVESVIKQGHWNEVGLGSIQLNESTDSNTEDEQEYEIYTFVNEAGDDVEVIEIEEGVFIDAEENEYLLECDEEDDSHTCPVCESDLDYEFTDEMLVEHISEVMDIVESLNEESGDFDEEDEYCSDFSVEEGSMGIRRLNRKDRALGKKRAKEGRGISDEEASINLKKHHKGTLSSAKGGSYVGGRANNKNRTLRDKLYAKQAEKQRTPFPEVKKGKTNEGSQGLKRLSRVKNATGKKSLQRKSNGENFKKAYAKEKYKKADSEERNPFSGDEFRAKGKAAKKGMERARKTNEAQAYDSNGNPITKSQQAFRVGTKMADAENRDPKKGKNFSKIRQRFKDKSPTGKTPMSAGTAEGWKEIRRKKTANEGSMGKKRLSRKEDALDKKAQSQWDDGSRNDYQGTENKRSSTAKKASYKSWVGKSKKGDSTAAANKKYAEDNRKHR